MAANTFFLFISGNKKPNRWLLSERNTNVVGVPYDIRLEIAYISFTAHGTR